MSLRIALVVEAFCTGTGRHVLDLTDVLSASGYDIHVLYSRRRADMRYVESLHTNAQITTNWVDIRRAPHPSDLRAAFVLRDYFKAHGPFDVVHGHSSKGVLGCVAATGSKAARIFTPHGLRSLDPKLYKAARLGCGAIESIASRFTDAVIAVSPDECEHARRIGMDAEKLHTVINGLRPSRGCARDEAREQIGLSPDDVCIGFVGRLVRAKAPERLLDVFERIAPIHPRARLAVVGDGPRRPGLVERAKRRGLSDRIIWLPNASGPDMIPGFDVFALPSLYEAMPYVLLEAAAAGLPIVVTDVGGASVAVKDGRNGYITLNWDESAFFEALERLVGDDALRTKMGGASCERAEAFTVDRMAAETVRVYQATLDRKAARSDVAEGSPPAAARPKDANG